MHFIKRHWFNFLMVLLIICGISLTLLIAFSPKEDAQNRGFIPCTQKLANRVVLCNGHLWCTTKAVIQNGWCDAKVIGQGIKLWINREQSAPWSNYYFTPDLSHVQNALNEHSELFYQENPNYIEDFEKLKQEHQKLEESINHEQTEEK